MKLHVNGTRVLDEAGVEVKLAGFTGYPRHTTAPSFELHEEDFRWMKLNGFNCWRFPFYWEQFETSKGVVDDSYWAYWDVAFDLCETYGIYAYIDNHIIGGSPWFGIGGHGAPSFYLDTYPSSSEGLTQWFLDFWANTGQAAEARLRLIEIWRYVANRYKDRNCVCAYELFNEPYSFTGNVANREIIMPQIMDYYNLQLAPAIRAIDAATSIIYDGHPGFPELSSKQAMPNVIWGTSQYQYCSTATHIYDSATEYADLRNFLKAQTDRYVEQFGSPYIATEVGCDITLQNNIVWLDDTVSLLDELTNGRGHFSYWRYSLGLDDCYSPRTIDGADKPQVSILQKYAVQPTPISPLPIVLLLGIPLAVILWLVLKR